MNVLRDDGQITAAVDCYQRALDLKPDMHEAHNNLSEDLSFRRVTRLAEFGDVALHLAHRSVHLLGEEIEGELTDWMAARFALPPPVKGRLSRQSRHFPETSLSEVNVQRSLRQGRCRARPSSRI